MGAFVAQELEPLERELAALRAQLAAREHLGTWSETMSYVKGNEVSSDGSTWRCLVDSKGVKPGDGGAVWRLIAKRGRDGRDGR
jgi:hypothetical protein